MANPFPIKIRLTGLQNFYLLSGKALIDLFRKPFFGKSLLEQMHHLGTGSFFLVSMVSFFIGLVLSLQLAAHLAPLGLNAYTGKAVGLSVIREIGPLAVALVFAARASSEITSGKEAGMLRRQAERIGYLDRGPVMRLVKPRVLGALIMLPVLTIIGDFLALLGGYIMAVLKGIQSSAFYWLQVKGVLNLESLVLGLSKPLLFGYLIACIGCYFGISTQGDRKGPGKRATDAVVFSMISVVVTDFMVTRLLLYMAGATG